MSLSRRVMLAVAAVVFLAVSVRTGWAVSYEQLAAKAKASEAAAEKAGAKSLPPPKDREEFQSGSGYQQAGAVLFWADMVEPLLDQPPTNADVLRRPWLMLAQDETACLMLAAYTVRGAKAVQPRVQLVGQDGKQPENIRLSAHPVVFSPVSDGERQAYRRQALWLADAGPVPAQQGHVVAWFLRIQATSNAAPGEYRLQVSVPWENEQTGTVPKDSVRVTVLPVRLTDAADRNYTFGVFCSGAEFSEAEFRQMKQHGLDAIQFFWGQLDIPIHRDGEKVEFDLARLDAVVEKMRKAGMQGPMVIALGNDSVANFESDVALTLGLPMQPRVERNGKRVKLADLSDPPVERAVVDALRQVFDHAAKNNWPEIVILPYDEPTERLMKEHKQMVRLFREHFPKVRLYGVVMDELRWAKMLLDTDILVANGDWLPIRDLARRNNKQVWYYRAATAVMDFGGCRASYGFWRYACGAEAAWFWSYNYFIDDPWNEFDGHTPDSGWVICWPPLEQGEEAISTPAYEGLRAAVEDVRYAMTLEQVLKQSKAPQAEQVRREYEACRQAQTGPSDPAAMPVLRDNLVRWILQAQGQSLPTGFERRCPETRPAAAQPAGFEPIDNEQM